jgi:hypothetical protein
LGTTNKPAVLFAVKQFDRGRKGREELNESKLSAKEGGERAGALVEA